MKKILGSMRRACDEFNMLSSGDRIAVGVSGGKDSMLLLYAMYLYRMYMKLDYELIALTVDLGFEGFDTQTLVEFIAPLDIKYEVIKTDIGKVVFDIRKETNPCSLCSKMRKGAFYERAQQLGCNKAAFAHSMDDAIETLLLSLLYEAKIGTFSPVTYLSRRDITLVRPFIYLSEKDIIHEVKQQNIPISKNPCPVNGNTKRQEIKELIAHLTKQNPSTKKSIIAAIKNTQNYHLWDKPSQ